MGFYLQKEYNCVVNGCVEYEGYSFNDKNFQEYLRGKVKERFDDAEWTARLITEAVKMTGFSEENFVEIFENREIENSWRIGEIIAECTLEDKDNVRFYYNSSRDSKNVRSNLTGADLVGFCDIDGEVCFLFGEVKTSKDPETPPNVLYGKSGMINQIEQLIRNERKRHDLVKWIFSKSFIGGHDFKRDVAEAMKTYINSGHNKLELVGVLVRDTKPTDKDLKTRAGSLGQNVPKGMKLRLLALYTSIKMENGTWEKVMNRGVEV